MAYVMNPFSYKLGYSLSWSDDWFSNKKLYPVMLQIMLTVRYFLVFFWSRRNIEKLDTYLSHLNLTLDCGKLLITLFFYEAKMNQLGKYKYSVLKDVIQSVPYSRKNAEFTVKKHKSYKSIGKRAPGTLKGAQAYFTKDNKWYDTLESQRFFLFFFYLGLDPGTFLLEFIGRYGSRKWGGPYTKKPLKIVAARRRNKRPIGKDYPGGIMADYLEFIFLHRIYRLLDKRVFFSWINEKEKNLNMVRFLRTLFFYGGMAYFGKRFAPLMAIPKKKLTDVRPSNKESKVALVRNYKKAVKFNNNIYVVKKKNIKKYKRILQKLQVINYFILLYPNYKGVLSSYWELVRKKSLKSFVKSALSGYKMKSMVVKDKEDETQDNSTERFYVDAKLKPVKKKCVNWRTWEKLDAKRDEKINRVMSFRKEKLALIKKNWGPIHRWAYKNEFHGSTKFDSWGGFPFREELKHYEKMIDDYLFSYDFRYKKLNICKLNIFHYYRLDYNVYGNFLWNKKEGRKGDLIRYINFPRNMSRYTFLNRKYKKSYDKFIKKTTSEFDLNFEESLSLSSSSPLTLVMDRYYGYENIKYLQNCLNRAVKLLTFYKTGKYWNFYKNFWDLRKFLPGIIENADIEASSLKLDTKEEQDHLYKLNRVILLEQYYWDVYDLYKSKVAALDAYIYFLEFNKTFINKYTKYKVAYSDYKLGQWKKKNLLKEKKKKGVLLWKNKYWSKFKSYREMIQYRAPFKNELNYRNNKPINNYYSRISKVRLGKPLDNLGVFHGIEQNNILIKNWFKMKKLPYFKWYIKKSISSENSQKLVKGNGRYATLPNIKKNFLCLDSRFKMNSIPYLKTERNLVDLKISENFKLANSFVKKHYLFKKKRNSSYNYFNRNLKKLQKNINYLRKLSPYSRKKYIRRFFNIWLHMLKKKEKKERKEAKVKEIIVDCNEWYKFIFRLRTKKFRYKEFKVYLKKKEEINWDRLYSLIKHWIRDSSFDYSSVKKKIINQEYDDKKEGSLLKKFLNLMIKRKIRQAKLGKFPRYGFDLYKYFSKKPDRLFLSRAKTLKLYKSYKKNLRYVRFSYTRLFFIFWFLTIRNERRDEYKTRYLTRRYGRENYYEFGSIIFLYLLKKPFYDFFACYIKSILKYWIGISLDFNYVILTNDEISAEFIANHIARAFYLGYKWREVVTPIRNDLKNLLTHLRVLEKRPSNEYFKKYNKKNHRIYEYSFIYIKLHIKNYLSSFNYFLSWKRFTERLEDFYYLGSVINEFRKKNPHLTVREIMAGKKPKKSLGNTDLWSFNVFLNHFEKLKYYYYYLSRASYNKCNNIYRCKSIMKWINYWGKEESYRLDRYSYKTFLRKIELKKSVFDRHELLKEYIIRLEVNRKKVLYNNFKYWVLKRLDRRHYPLFKKKKEDIDKYFYYAHKIKVFKYVNDIAFDLVISIKDTREFRNDYLNSVAFERLVRVSKLNRESEYVLTWQRVWNTFISNPNFSFFFRYDEIVSLMYFYYVFSLQFGVVLVEGPWYNFFNIILGLTNKYSYIFLKQFFFYQVMVKAWTPLLASTEKVVHRCDDRAPWWKKNLRELLKESWLEHFDLIHKFMFALRSIAVYVDSRALYLKNESLDIREERDYYKGLMLRSFDGWIYRFFKDCRKINRYKVPLKKIIMDEAWKRFDWIYKMFLFSSNLMLTTNVFFDLFKLKSLVARLINTFIFVNWDHLHEANLKINMKGRSIVNWIKEKKIKRFKMFEYENSKLDAKTICLQKLKLLSNISFIRRNRKNNWMYLPTLGLKVILDFRKKDWNLLKVVDRGLTFNKRLFSKDSSVMKKETFVDYFYQNRFLLGYKIRFSGRFKRRRKRALMWIKKGLLPVTSHNKWIDYGAYESANKHSKYSVRVWLNKNKNVKYKHYLKF